MAKVQALATKIPSDLKQALDDVCKKLGLKKNFVVETALREKLEDLLDTYDLSMAVRESTGFAEWGEVKKALKHKGRL